MTTTNLDQISQEITQLMIGVAENEAAIQPLVKKIWAAFDDAKAKRTTITIEGTTNKTAWTKLAGKPKMRYCQYLVRDGNRKRSAPGARDDTPLALLKKLITIISENRNDYPVIKGEAQEICDSIGWHPPVFQEENKEVAQYNRTGEVPEEKKPVKHARFDSNTTWCGKRSTHGTNMAQQKRYATCEYCKAAMEANIHIARPEKGQTPEQAVEAEKARRAARKALREQNETQPKHIFHPTDERVTLCGESVVYDEGDNLYTQFARGASRPATCPTCIEQSKQIGLGVTERQQEASVILQPILAEVL
jgi:hypothetical protein